MLRGDDGVASDIRQALPSAASTSSRHRCCHTGFCARWYAVHDTDAAVQGLTLVHFQAQPKPFRSHLPVSPCLIDWGIAHFVGYVGCTIPPNLLDRGTRGGATKTA